ncbi:asparagine synthetase [glutamine-hydrolyzing] 3-like [Rosa chinensis]|uniref:asparagine synthetase [glutamine-hydrolyzing] 3-like n=1 Tax=Rosa chinensis TaxID=74649 RepID=UPI001AD9183C|nr:asparagine synthetase [glutamine-hydrolyzing] 3-like [Rosa chinensis]
MLCIFNLQGSPDLKAAREVADYLGTHHHEFHFTVQEGIDALEVIYHIETYDVTTVRASTPMFLMSRKIKSLGVKMVLSGEGSDEIFGGYLYFHKAPNKEEFHQETCQKVFHINYLCIVLFSCFCAICLCTCSITGLNFTTVDGYYGFFFLLNFCDH